jgi:threonine/homoserine/homoserine lactone efflux protein
MALHLWLGFALAYLITTLSPGPNVLLVIRNSLRYGAPSAGVTILGNLLSQLMVVLLVACGVGAVIAALPQFFLLMKVAGAGYLIWLGIKQIRSGGSVSASAEADEQRAIPAASKAKLFREAFLVSSSNPKTLIFLSAFMPQFIDQSRPLPLQFAIMYLTIAACVLCVHCVYSVSVSQLKHKLRSSRLVRTFKYLGGSLFVLLGLRLLASER